MSRHAFFTSESVTAGHPDKLCDQIADSILDKLLEQDSDSRVACEVCITTGLVLVVGEVTTKAYVDIQKIVRSVLRRVGYTNPQYGLDADSCGVLISLDSQSPDIAIGVDGKLGEKQLGAGDQGMMFGYACDETEELMPCPIMLAHKLTRRLDGLRKEKILEYLRPDGKSQITVEYDENGQPLRIDTVVVSAQHEPTVSQHEIFNDLKKYLFDYELPKNLIDEDTKFLVNPTGRFVIGAPKGDSGVTGRKIIADSYGGYAKHGGGAFSGKDYTKVDRTGAYAARYVAKNIVAAGLAAKCEVQLSYAIGIAEPISVDVDCFGTNKIDETKIIDLIKNIFDLTPVGIIKTLDLKRPIYQKTSVYGHFGNKSFPWEKTNKVEAIRSYLLSNQTYY